MQRVLGLLDRLRTEVIVSGECDIGWLVASFKLDSLCALRLVGIFFFLESSIYKAPAGGLGAQNCSVVQGPNHRSMLERGQSEKLGKSPDA